MPVIYGEGRDNAVNRLKKEIEGASSIDKQDAILQELSTYLPIATDAAFNSLAKQHEPICLENTRVDLLDYIRDWTDGQDERCIFWLSGWAGTGKSTVGRTVARRCFDSRRLGASFFFTRGGGDLGNATKFVTSIAAQLANSIRPLRRHLLDVVQDNHAITSMSLQDQWQALVVGPLLALQNFAHQRSFVLVIDAVDECDDDRSTTLIVQLLASARALKAARVRILLTCRPEVPIRYGFSQIPAAHHTDFVLHNISRSIVDQDIFTYLTYTLGVIAQERSLPKGWPGSDSVHLMVNTSCGLFIWAAIACRFIRAGQRFASKRLHMILKATGSDVTAPQKHLDEIYATILENSVSAEYTTEEKEEAYEMLRSVLGSLVVLASALPRPAVRRLLNLSVEDFDQTLEDLHSILEIPDDEDLPLRLHHPSLRDFLLAKHRSDSSKFWVDQFKMPTELLACCIRVMSSNLERATSHIQQHKMARYWPMEGVDSLLPSELRYACLHWIEHLEKSNFKLSPGDIVHQFLYTHLLHWLETLSWMKRWSDAVRMIYKLESVANLSSCGDIFRFLYDAMRFMLYARPALEEAPHQIHRSALVFAPRNCKIKQKFAHQFPQWTSQPRDLPLDYSAELSTLEGHDSAITAVVFSESGRLLATASHDKSVRLWDGESGESLATLSSCRTPVSAIVFLTDDSRVVTASISEVKIWDTKSAALLMSLIDGIGFYSSLVGSPDGTQLAFASQSSVLLWHGGVDDPIMRLTGHSDTITALVYSPDSRRVASAADDCTIRLWNVEDGVELAVSTSHTSLIKALAWSHEDEHLISVTYNGAVERWAYKSNTCMDQMQKLLRHIERAAFSYDGKKLATASYERTIRLWDCEQGVELRVLAYNVANLKSMGFLRDADCLILVSHSGSIHLWNWGTGKVASHSEFWDWSTVKVVPIPGGDDLFTCIGSSPDKVRLATGSGDGTVRLWDTQLLFKAPELPETTVDDPSSMSLTISVELELSTPLTGSAFRAGHSGVAWGQLKANTLPLNPSPLDVIFEFTVEDGQLVPNQGPGGSIAVWETFPYKGLPVLDSGAEAAHSIECRVPGLEWLGLDTDYQVVPEDQEKWEEFKTIRSQRKGEWCLEGIESRHLKVRGSWTEFRDQKLLWLPQEYRDMRVMLKVNGLKSSSWLLPVR